jgi:hypothetical protein
MRNKDVKQNQVKESNDKFTKFVSLSAIWQNKTRIKKNTTTLLKDICSYTHARTHAPLMHK